MNKRGEGILWDNIIYILLFLVFFLMMFYFVSSYQDGAFFWEDFYAKEITNLINHAEPGIEFKIDVSKLAVIAVKRGKNLHDLISIDNVNNKIIVSVRNGVGTSFNFFNDVDIVEPMIDTPSGGAATTRFIFKTAERKRGIPQV